MSASLVSGLVLVAFFYNLNGLQRWTDRNFRGVPIPTSVGIAFGATCAGLVPQSLLWRCMQNCSGINADEQFHLPVLFVSCVIAFTILGLLDDRCGSHEITGLRGHFRMLAQGRVTTGAIKALGGGLTALVVAAFVNQYADRPLSASPHLPFVVVVVDAMLIALGSNAINLLDRRPARALKGYAIGLALALLVGSHLHVWLIIPISAAALVFAPLDFRCKAMMGDAGSNTLGAALGVYAALDMQLPWKTVTVAALLAFNLLSEKVSYTKLIESNRALRWLDRLGVPS